MAGGQEVQAVAGMESSSDLAPTPTALTDEVIVGAYRTDGEETIRVCSFYLLCPLTMHYTPSPIKY